MKSALCFAGVALCMCGIVTAQKTVPPGVSREKVIPVSGGSVNYGSRNWGFWKSQQRPQIAVDWDDKPLSGASVEVYRAVGPDGELPKGKPLAILTSDASGHVVLPRLRPGKYYIRGRSKPDREDEFSMEISQSGRNWPHLVLNLTPARDSPEWVFGQLGKTPRDEPRISVLRGVVNDPGDRPAPHANIDVFLSTLGINQQPIHLRADSRGEFSANLPDGQYAVNIQKDGSQCMFWVDISKTAASARLQVTLYPVEID
jgi:hypothetical protein